MLERFKIFLDEKSSENDALIDQIAKAFKDILDLKVRIVGIRIPSKTAWVSNLQGYNARELLNNITGDGFNIFLWLVDHPILLDDEEVFGHVERRKGAIMSTTSLNYNEPLIINETLYYAGIVLGLSPCTSECIMNTGASLQEIQQKPNTLCKTCNLKYQKLK